MKADGAFLTLRDFVAERLDAEDTNVAAWAMDHTGPFGLGSCGTVAREACLARRSVRAASSITTGELNLADLTAVMGAGQAKTRDRRSVGPATLCAPAAERTSSPSMPPLKSPVVMKVAGQTIEFGKPIELPAGLHAMDVTVDDRSGRETGDQLATARWHAARIDQSKRVHLSGLAEVAGVAAPSKNRSWNWPKRFALTWRA